jgi:hypothetical protein
MPQQCYDYSDADGVEAPPIHVRDICARKRGNVAPGF